MSKLLVIFLFFKAVTVFANEQLPQDSFTQKVYQSVVNYSDDFMGGLKAIDQIINDELPHACVIDKNKEQFRYQLENHEQCNEELYGHLQTVLRVEGDTRKVLDYLNPSDVDLDQWVWMRDALGKEVASLECSKNLLQMEDQSGMEQGFDKLVDIKKKLKLVEKDLAHEIMHNEDLKKILYDSYSLRSDITDPQKRKEHFDRVYSGFSSQCNSHSELGKAMIEQECPDTGKIGLFGSHHGDVSAFDDFGVSMFGGYNDSGICRKGMMQNRYMGEKRIPFRSDPRKWGNERTGALIDKCLSDRFVNGDVKHVFETLKNQNRLPAKIATALEKYKEIKNLEDLTYATQPLLQSDEMKIAVGQAAYIDISEDSAKHKFKESFKLAKAAQLKRLNDQINEYDKAIDAKNLSEIRDHLSNYDFLKAVVPYYTNPNTQLNHWEFQTGCNIQRRYIRQGGLEDLKNLVTDAVIAVAPLGTGLVAKGLLVGKNALMATKAATNVRALKMAKLSDAMNKSVGVGKSTGMSTLSASVALEGGFISYDTNLLMEQIDRCEKIVGDSMNSKLCVPNAPGAAQAKQEYKECKQLLSDSVTATTIAILGGAFTIGAETKALFSRIAKDRDVAQSAVNRQVNTPYTQAENVHNVGPRTTVTSPQMMVHRVKNERFEPQRNVMGKIIEKFGNTKARQEANMQAMINKYNLKNGKPQYEMSREDEIYFAGMAKEMETDLIKSGKTRAEAQSIVSTKLDEVMTRCNQKVKVD